MTIARQDEITVSIGHLTLVYVGCTPANNNGKSGKCKSDEL